MKKIDSSIDWAPAERERTLMLFENTERISIFGRMFQNVLCKRKRNIRYTTIEPVEI